MILFRRLVQLGFLSIYFLLLTSAASWYFAFMLPIDFFLKLDPAMMMITALTTRSFGLALVPGLVILLSGLVLGRAFCGYVCPMGTTLDGGDKFVKTPYRKQKRLNNLKQGKYLVLIFLICASMLSVALVFWFSPIALITRFYGLVMQPLVAVFFDNLLTVSLPLLDHFNLDVLLFTKIDKPRFATSLFVLAFFVLLVALGRWSPRFWCRYLCPSGALLAITSRKPLVRRQVSHDCTNCGKCIAACPMGAISEDDYTSTHHEECLVCLTCQKICPEAAVSFVSKKEKNKPAPKEDNYLPGRRQVILTGLSGAGMAMVGLNGLHAPYGETSKGRVAPATLIRPPAALPEADFLDRCVRCGECMIACPMNLLQPTWLKAGFLGMFSPEAILKRGPCNPECHHCSDVCPTGAIRSISIEDRLWAKMGTAIISRRTCLAWEQQKKCMVCDEVCPFNAVEFTLDPGNPVTVPHVIEDKCTGCGYCEHHCPVQNESAIIISPMGELRLAAGSYRKEGEYRGLKIILKSGGEYDLSPYGGETGALGPAPGFEE